MKKVIWWILKKLLKNLGKADEGIYRSGQPGFIRRRIIYWLIKPKTRINLAYSPNYDKQDIPETEFLINKGVKVYTYQWSAGGPTTQVMEVLVLLRDATKPIWIGCEGGRDRTGGIVAYWKKMKGTSLVEIIEDFGKHGIPAEGWLELVFK